MAEFHPRSVPARLLGTRGQGSAPTGHPGPRRPLTLSWDLETLPLFSTSRAVKAYQMDLSSSLRRAMAEVPARPGGGSDTEIRFQEMRTAAETAEGPWRGARAPPACSRGLSVLPGAVALTVLQAHSLCTTWEPSPGEPEACCCPVWLPGRGALYKSPQPQKLLGLPGFPEAAC